VTGRISAFYFPAFFFLIFLLSENAEGQVISFDELLLIATNKLDVKHLPEIKQYFPDKYSITALDIGDFSGDNKNDFAIGVKPVRKKGRQIYTYMFVDSAGTYIPVKMDTLEYVELPIEVGFAISKNVCYLTHKEDDKQWSITGYSFKNNELFLVDFYHTRVKMKNGNPIGLESYRNYLNLSSFDGYYNTATLQNIEKTEYLTHPVYSEKRNLYHNYSNSADIDSKWCTMCEDSAVSMHAEVKYSYSDTSLLFARIKMPKNINENLKNGKMNSLKLYFSIADDRITTVTKRKKIVKNDDVSNLGEIEIDFKSLEDFKPVAEYQFGDEFDSREIRKIKISLIKNNDDKVITVAIPMSLFNCEFPIKSLFNFTQLSLYNNDNKNIILSNSNGNPGKPSTFARLMFISDNDHYGEIVNAKFDILMNDLKYIGIVK
jgi:hypothetical protein